MSSILVRLFEHNRWANLRVIEACASLTESQLEASVLGTAGTVRETLMHIAGSEQHYVRRLTGREATYEATYRERHGWPGSEGIRKTLDESGGILMELAARADPSEILRWEVDGRLTDVPVATVYVQAINHATEHRSQIATILTQQGLDPPNFSGWAWSRG